MISENQKKYLEEYEKYKDVQLSTSEIYVKKSMKSEKVILTEINKRKKKATVKNIRSGVVQEKTLHWCRKNLQVVDYISETEKLDDWLADKLK